MALSAMASASSSSLFFPKPSTTFSSSSKTVALALPSISFSQSSPHLKFTPFLPPLNSSRLSAPKATLLSELEHSTDSSSSDEAEFTPDLKLFVGNLPYSVDSAQLAGLFERAGTVEMVEVIYDKQTGRSRGFGFVTMSSAEEAQTAVQQFNNYEIEGRVLRVNSGPPPRRDGFQSKVFKGSANIDAANRVYVGNLSWRVDNLALETFFSGKGKVMEARVVYDRESGRSRGFGFVSFSSAEEMDNAIASLNGIDLDGRLIKVTVAEPRPKRELS